MPINDSFSAQINALTNNTGTPAPQADAAKMFTMDAALADAGKIGFKDMQAQADAAIAESTARLNGK